MRREIVGFSVDHPRWIFALMAAATIFFGALITNIKIDTDPENMLSEDEFARVFHHRVKTNFNLHDFIILGVVNEKDPDGVFNTSTLGKIVRITDEIKKIDGVITYDLTSLSTVDNISQAGAGVVSFEWLMAAGPESREEALRIRENAWNNPMLNGTIVSEDGMAAAIYIPIEKKDISFRVASDIKQIIAPLEGDEQYHITGLPVAEDTFGVEMFKQMAISAPLAGLVIFLLMLFFFRSMPLVISPMILAIVSIVSTMGLLIGLGHTVHIMSSMIPIFLMPIAVVDSVHILSEFFDSYRQGDDKRETIMDVMDTLFMPMFYTSITSMVGFASLAFTPIPPVKVFGLFIAFGIMLAWLLSITFIPAYIMMMDTSSFKRLKGETNTSGSFSSRVLNQIGSFSTTSYKTVFALTALLVLISAYGITKININDNPVKWFEKKHPIRVADRILNKHFGGTYTAYLVLEERKNRQSFIAAVEEADKNLPRFLKNAGADRQTGVSILELLNKKQEEYLNAEHYDRSLFFSELADYADEMTYGDDELAESWYAVLDFFEERNAQFFKRPDMLRYIERLQEVLQQSGIVGKSTSLSNIVKKIHYELREGDKAYNVIPDKAAAVAQVLISFQNSHDPDDLWHFVTPDYSKANIWVQLKSGDNQDMEKVVRNIDSFIRENPPPEVIDVGWGGLTYLNVVWQEKMVAGMLKSLAGSFVIVLVLMIILFRSFAWGVLAMLPLSVTIMFIYGLIGLIGKDYDMPIAILSSLTLGLSIDFAIHFLERSRSIYNRTGNWQETVKELFEEPANAISRNMVVIAMGFLPLLLAPLVPYKTVGFFLAGIMILSGFATLVLLPSIITAGKKIFFKE